ncbi:hypothetical protein R0131_04030 [Clostridium sp. AL.422]|uniref:hypothetical protein n=1 Tax=Clostridium TaxID=1485 RepID=UPI00293DD69A|nr:MULTISPECIES: hypothetical protein [unclassified Clostridium]MDV4149998.1 hypothetical protein [Clostridium sp. AL.422]
MKRSTFLAIAGVILAFFIVSAFGNRQKLYEKKDTFNRPEDAIVNFIGYINTFETVKDDNGYYDVPSIEFLESISKRYRLYVGLDNSYKFISESVPVLFSYEMKEVDYDSLINLKNNYEDSFKNISKYNRSDNPRVYRLDGYGSYNMTVKKSYSNEDGTTKNAYEDEEIPITIYLIVIDEGEGFVVDYYSVIYQ